MAVTDTTTKTPVPELEAPRPLPARSIRRRRRLERLTYGAATLGITIAPHNPDWWPAHLTAAAGAIGSLAWMYGRYEDAGFSHWLLQACQRSIPLLTGSALYLTDLLHPGAPWWENVLPAVWGAAMVWMTPLTGSRNLTPHTIPAPPAPADAAALETVQAPPTTFPAYRAWQWEQSDAGRGTQLVMVRQYQDGHPDFEGIVVAPQGKAVGDPNATALAAAFDMPIGSVLLLPLDGSGPGRKRLIAAPTVQAQAQQQKSDPMQRLWDDKIAHPRGGAPGMLLAGYRTDDNRVAIRVAAPEDQLITFNQKLLARALTPHDATLCMVESDGLGEGVISVYKKHPLLTVREATVEDLTMQADGTIQIGLRPDGRAARMPLYDPQLGALTNLFVGAMGAGKSVTLNTKLAAERISGIVSIVADAQNGMSLPEADGRVYHFGKGIAAVGATLAAAYEVAQYREKVSSDNGWAGFELNDPWPLANITLDELNRILSSDAVVPRNFRKWVTGLVGDFQSTGRKFGMGIDFAAQSIHLADLGDKDKIRANSKNGTVWLGRTNSSTTNHMATDGVIPPGVTLDPIPPNFQNGNDIDAAFHGREAKKGPRTAGLANVIQGGSVFQARTFNARKENKTYPGLVALYESAPIPVLTAPEHDIFTRAYAKWLPHAEALLAGDEGDGADDQAYAEQDLLADDQDAVSGASIKQRILALLAHGPMALRDVRAKMPDVAAGSVNNAMTSLRESGHVTPAGNRGIYQLAQ